MEEHSSFWLNRKVLVTGHTGFKGSWLCTWLCELGAEVVGLAHPPGHARRLFETARLETRVKHVTGDVRDLEMLRRLVRRERPEIIFHLAASPIVLECLKQPVETFATNTMGTLHLLEAARAAPDLRAIVAVTSDKVYRDPAGRCQEEDPLGGTDPYSASKAAAEHVIETYRHCFLLPEDGIGLASARAGNVIGGGDFSPHRLIPDLVRGIHEGRTVEIRHPGATRPWQHVLDALAGYLRLAEMLAAAPRKFGGSWNFGPDETNRPWTVAEIADALIASFGRGSWQTVGPPTGIEAPRQHLCSRRSRELLGWRPRLDMRETVEWTARGYRALLDGDEDGWILDQIRAYESGPRPGMPRLPKAGPVHADA